jgi:hypothetical protein
MVERNDGGEEQFKKQQIKKILDILTEKLHKSGVRINEKLFLQRVNDLFEQEGDIKNFFTKALFPQFQYGNLFVDIQDEKIREVLIKVLTNTQNDYQNPAGSRLQLVSVEEQGNEVSKLPENRMDQLCNGAREKFRKWVRSVSTEEANKDLFSFIDINKLIENFGKVARLAYLEHERDRHLLPDISHVDNFLVIVFGYFLNDFRKAQDLFYNIYSKTPDFNRSEYEIRFVGLLRKFHEDIKKSAREDVGTGRVLPFKKQ